jgi:hypothetical protein
VHTLKSYRLNKQTTWCWLGYGRKCQPHLAMLGNVLRWKQWLEVERRGVDGAKRMLTNNCNSRGWFFHVPIIYDLPWHPSSFPLMFLPSSILVIDPHHLFCSLLQFIVFLIKFSSKKKPKMTSIKKTTLWIWTS